jgi:hypothetical protein
MQNSFSLVIITPSIRSNRRLSRPLNIQQKPKPPAPARVLAQQTSAAALFFRFAIPD